MSFTDDFLKGLNKRNVSLGQITTKNVTVDTAGDDFTKAFLSGLEKRKKKQEEDEIAVIKHDLFGDPSDDIAPTKDDDLLDFFQKGSFGDGFDWHDVPTAILGTAGDIGLNVVKGAGNMLEGITDLIGYAGAGIAEKTGNQAYADQIRKNTKVNLIDKWTKPADDYLNQYSVLGRTSDAIAQGIGQVGSIILTGGIGQAAGLGTAGVTALTTGTMGISGMGSGMGEAYKDGATDEEAVQYGMIAGAADALSELMFGGLGKAVNATGLSTGVLGGVDDILAEKVSGLFSSQIAKNFAEYGIKATAEGVEEVVAGIAQAMGKKLTYMSEEELSEILKDENLLEQFVVGMATSGIAQAPGVNIANKTNTDFITGRTQNEQAVMDKEVQKRIAELEKDGKKLTGKEKSNIEAQVEKEMEKGYISIDTIEETLGGEAFTEYRKTVDEEDAIRKEYEELGNKENPTLADRFKYEELHRRVNIIDNTSKRDYLHKKLTESVQETVRGDRLIESYNERARRGQAFEADLSKYDAKQRAVIENAQKSGILNNTNRTHEFVDMVAKISADKGVLFDFTNNAKLKESGFAVEGKAVNGYVTKDGITVNIQSPKALNSTVGHEITHVLEGTDLYTELQKSVIEYAKTKGEYQTRFDALSKLYENVEGADINAELTADLVGDYLFTDENFINNLSVNHRNVFQKIYDEVKYLVKVATAGSKEARELERVKRAFEKAYRAEQTAEETDVETDDVRYSISVQDEATLNDLNDQVARGEYDPDTNPNGGYYVTYKSMSFWGYDEDGNAILRSPMAEYVDGELSNAYLLPKDKSKLNWYQATETIDEKTGLPSGLLVGIKEEGKKSKKYVPASENQDLIAEDWSNLYFMLNKKVFNKKTGKWKNSPVPARYNPYEHSSNSMLNDQFKAAWQRDNLVTVKMYVPRSEDNGAYRAQWSKDPTGWSDWKSGDVATKINKQKDLQRRVFLSRYAAPVEIVPDSEVAQAYKGYVEGTDVAIPDNVVSPSLLAELKKAGVPIVESGSVQYSLSSNIDTTGMDEDAKDVIRNLKRETFASKYGLHKFASYTSDRIEQEIADSMADGLPDYAHSYIAWVDPEDFVRATTTGQQDYERILDEAGDLDYDRLKGESQPIYLHINARTNQIVGHEGRHRISALRKAGYDRVAVIVRSNSPNDIGQLLFPEKSMKVKGQVFTNDIAGTSKKGVDFWLHNMLPLSEKYADAAKKLFSNTEGSLQYSLSSDSDGRQLTNEQIANEAKFSLSKDTEYMDKAISMNQSALLVDRGVMDEAKAVRGRIAERMKAIKDRGLVGLPEDIEGKTYIANSSYDGTEENTTICPRSLAAEAFTDAVSEYLGRPLSVEEQIYISQDLQGRSLTPECTYCYVATDRKAYRAFLGEYINQRDVVIQKVQANPDADVSRNGDLYKEFLNGRKDTTPMYNRFKMWVNAYRSGTPMINASHLANISKLMGDINSEFGAELKPQIVDAMKYAQSASWAKKRVNYVAYNGHILKWKQDRINKLNSHYGLRMYSFSDFHPAFVLENMQMITDASVRGLKMLGYTKDTDFVEIFAPTGMNINVSTFGFETGGEVFENNIIGAQWDKAKELRGKYPNVGITFVATNDTLVNWALDQDWIDVVIPYHLVRTGAEVAKAFGYTNYTSESADTKGAEWSKGKDKKYIAPTEHNNDKATYLAALEKNHLKPRFERFLSNPNYMKLVNECRQPASQSKPVQPTFNEDAAMVALAKLEANGYYQPVGGSVERMYEIAAEVAENMTSRLTPGARFSLSNTRTYAEITEEQQKLFQRERLLADRKREAVNNPELLQAMDDYSGLFTEMRELLPKRKQGTATQAELERIEEIITLREAYLNRVAELQESLGLNAITQEETEIRETKEALRIAADAAWAREGAEKENRAIAKSGLSAPEYFRKKALKSFKTTTNFNEAGYMLPDGKLLNFSGGERNHRYRDHREIGEIYEATQGVYALNRFLNDGNIRIMAESPGIDIASGVEPTKEQYAALRKFINTNGAVEGQFFVDFSDMEGRNAGKYAYTGRIAADRIINDIKYFYQNGKVRESSGLLDFLSLSANDEAPVRYGNYNVYGSDVALETEIAPVAVSETENTTPAQKKQLPAENATVSKEERLALFPETQAPDMELESLIQRKSELETRMQDAFNEGDAEAMEQLGVEYSEVMDRLVALESEIAETEEGRLGSIQDADAPPEVEAPYYEEEAPVQPENPMADRNIDDVGNRKVKAYMFENPEVKPYFQAEARVMLGDLGESVRGEKLYNDQLYYESGGEKGWSGVRRQTTADIADLLDNYGYTYAQIEKGLNAIIEDNGKENNAVSKRIEFALNDRLLNGYTNVWGEEMPPDQDYIRFLQEKEITEYSQEAFESLMANADQYAPEEIAPVIAPAAVTSEESTAVEDIAPTYDVTGKKGVPDGQQAFLPDAGVEAKVTRKQLHQNIVDRVKDIFHVRGFEFDDVLKKAKDLSTFATVDNTPQRVMEKALGYKQGQILSDITVNKVAQNETKGIQWLNSFTDRKNGLLAQISKQYGIKPGSKQSAAAQMYAEGFYVGENDEIIAYTDKELAVDFPDPKVRANIKGLASDPRIRKIYDETLAAINESRTRNAYPEIPRLDNYFLHFRAMEDTFSRLGLPFNPNDIRAKDLPTDLNGVTADLKPGQPYFASAMHRTGKRTSFDLLGGLEKYLTSAKNQIYHIDDIQTLRALRNYVAEQYGQAQGLSNLNELSDEEAAQRIEAVYDSHLSTFAKFLNEEANVLAGKTALIDRGLEGIIGRRGITFLDTLNRQVGSNMVGYNISSSLTNFIAPVQALAKSNKADFLKGFAQTAANKVGSIFGRGDSFAEESPVMIRRKGAERFYRTPWQKLSDPGYVLMGAVDDISTELIARAKYNEFTRQGMDSQTAHFETDKWVSRLMGDRSLGQQPQLYNSKMLGIITKFQLEVRNQLDSQFYDTIQEAKASTEDIENGLARNARKAAKVTSTFVQLAVLQHLFGKAFESVAGYNPAFDIISAIIKAFGWDDDEEDEDTVLDNIEEGFFELMGDMPYVSTMTGGRVPLESALPIQELYKGEDQYGNEKSRWETLAQAAPYWLLPGGYGQIKKTKQGLGMFDEDLPIAGSYTDSGKLRFPVEDTPINRLQAALFGQYASENARDYFDNERKALGENQIEEFLDSDLPIRDYWEYREGLSGLDKLSEKADYIDSLDLPISTKNLFINNIADRKERIDMTGYSNYSSFEEFDFAKKNPEKYSFLKENGVSVEQYNGFDEKTKDVYSWAFDNPERYQFLRSQGVTLHAYRDFDKETREAYGWAYENPDSISLAKTVGGIVEYSRIAAGWKDLDAKDEFGNSVSGLKKQRVYDYIYSLDIPEAEKHILFKSRYTSDDSHNYEIIDYLNSRADITYDEMIEILKKLKFEVDEEGNIYW